MGEDLNPLEPGAARPRGASPHSLGCVGVVKGKGARDREGKEERKGGEREEKEKIIKEKERKRRKRRKKRKEKEKNKREKEEEKKDKEKDEKEEKKKEERKKRKNENKEEKEKKDKKERTNKEKRTKDKEKNKKGIKRRERRGARDPQPGAQQPLCFPLSLPAQFPPVWQDGTQQEGGFCWVTVPRGLPPSTTGAPGIPGLISSTFRATGERSRLGWTIVPRASRPSPSSSRKALE